MNSSNEIAKQDEIQEVEVIDSDLEVLPDKPADDVPLVKAQIRESLQKIDPTMASLWDEIGGLVDQNQLIAVNLKLLQVHVQQIQEDYTESKNQESAVMQKFIDLGESYLPEYLLERDRLDKKKMLLRNDLVKIVMSIRDLAKEYRQCIQQKKFTVHISQVLQWKMAIEASIHRNVRDQRILHNIAEDIISAGRALFPINGGESD